MESLEAPIPSEEGHLRRASALAERFTDNIETVVYGKREEIKLVLSAMLCGGHVLFEDVPGTAKLGDWANAPLVMSRSPARETASDVAGRRAVM